MAASKFVTLKSSDGQMFEVDEAVAMVSQILKDMIEIGVHAPIPLPYVPGRILEKIIQYGKYRVESPIKLHEKPDDKGDDIRFGPDAEDLLKDADGATLFGLIQAADFLNIQRLLNLICQFVADLTKSKTLEGVRQLLNIKKGVTPPKEEGLESIVLGLRLLKV